MLLRKFILCGIFLSTSAIVFSDTICQNIPLFNIQSSEYFSIPINYNPYDIKHTEFLMCFFKRNLPNNMCAKIFLLDNEVLVRHAVSKTSNIVGKVDPTCDKTRFYVHEREKPFTKASLPIGAVPLGSIHKLDSGEIILGRFILNNENFDIFSQIVGDLSTYSANFNSITQEQGLNRVAGGL